MAQFEQDPQDAAQPPPNTLDLELTRRILADDPQAWEEFVHRFAGLLFSVVRRHLRTRDVDEVRTVVVDVLVALRRTKLRTYQGRAALSTWLTLVARSEALEALRRRFGRGQDVKGRERLSSSEQRLFRLYHVERRTYHEIITQLSADGDPWTVERFLTAVRTVEEKLGPRRLRRHAYDLHAQSVGAESGRMLEYLDHVREEARQHPGGRSPEYHLMEREAHRTAERLAAHIEEMDPQDRRLLQLRFEHGRTAKEIADELGLPGLRGVYSTTDRIVRQLRRWFGEQEP